MRRQKVHETKTNVFLVWFPCDFEYMSACFPWLCERLQDVPLPLPSQAGWATWINVLALLCTPFFLERCRRKWKERWARLDQETKLSGQTMENGSCEKKSMHPFFHWSLWGEHESLHTTSYTAEGRKVKVACASEPKKQWKLYRSIRRF